MRTIDEAIMQEEEMAEKNEEECKNWTYGASRINDDESRKKQYLKHAEMWQECAAEHRQLAEWLRELKAYRESWEYLFATIYEIKSNAENEDIKNITNFLLKYMRIYEKEIGEVKADDSM